MSMGTRIRRAREQAGLQQGELAKAVGMKQSSLSEVETGESKEPRASHFWRMAQVLQVSPRWLAEGKGPMNDQFQSEQERELLTVFRSLDERSRAAVLASAYALRGVPAEADDVAPLSRRLHITR